MEVLLQCDGFKVPPPPPNEQNVLMLYATRSVALSGRIANVSVPRAKALGYSVLPLHGDEPWRRPLRGVDGVRLILLQVAADRITVTKSLSSREKALAREKTRNS
jgi:hypothetical protein